MRDVVAYLKTSPLTLLRLSILPYSVLSWNRLLNALEGA